MKTHICARPLSCLMAGLLTLGLGLAWMASADQVEMKNGDRYVGQVVSLSPDKLVLKNEILGTLKLPRSKVARLTFETNAIAPLALQQSTNAATATLPAGLSARAATLAQSTPTLNTPTNVMQQVQAQLLRDAPPAATQKYQELAAGFLSGQISEAQIRTEAQSAADQIKKLKADLGADAGDELDGYLAILENFLRESQTTSAGPAKPTTSTSLPPASTGK